jgi:hypothetical protein
MCRDRCGSTLGDVESVWPAVWRRFFFLEPKPKPRLAPKPTPSKGVELTFKPERLTQGSGSIGFDTAGARAHEAHGYSRSL